MKDKQDQGKAKTSVFWTEALSPLTTSSSNYSMSFTASDWCGSGGLIWAKLEAKGAEPLCLTGWWNVPLWISQEHFRQIQDLCLPWCHGRKRCLMLWRQHRALRLLGSSHGPICNTKLCKWMNFTQPLLFLPSGLVILIVLKSRRFFDSEVMDLLFSILQK